MIKWIKASIAFCVTSFYLFPIMFRALPGMNTKTFMAAVGVVFCAYTLLTKRNASVPKNLFPLFLLAVGVSLAGVLSMTINNTIDDAYSGYIASMAVWLSAAYVVCCLIKWTHGTINMELLINYVVAVCVMQCVSVLLIDNVPVVKDTFDTYVNIDQKTIEQVHRLYGFGANLDVSGSRFAACLLMITALLCKHKDDLNDIQFLSYVGAFIIITVVGSMVARTTYVGFGLSMAFIGLTMTYSTIVSSKTVNRIILLFLLLSVIILACVYFYHTDANFRYWIRFAFEGFFNYFENGKYSVASTNTLRSMYVFPDNAHTWIIGDGYFSNPYWSDPTYTYIDQNIKGYYKETDVGYLRFIFYFGVIGLVAFSVFMCKAAQTCIDTCKKYTALFIFVLLANFVIWFKVATDLFIIFALFICTVNMLEDDNTNDTYDNIASL